MFKKIIHWCSDQIKTAKPFCLDHIGVCMSIILLGWLLYFVSEKIGIFDPIKAAFEDFYMTDIYYEITHSEEPPHDADIVIVDMTNLSTRDEIAQVITDIKSCKPKVLCVDLIFEHPSFDTIDDVSLITSLETDECKQVLSCKLRDYDKESSSFRNCLYSFFYGFDNKNILWGYSNYSQIRMGGYTRHTTLSQKTNDSIVFSLPYTAACLYQEKKLQRQEIEERQILYGDIDFNVINSCDILKESDKIKDKLVVLGSLHEEADMHFTPLGKMAGVKVIAYSIRTYLKGGEVKELGTIGNLLIGILVWWFAACIGYLIEKRHPIVYGILAKIFNFTLVAILIWISFEIYARYSYHINLLIPLTGLAMAEDIREMYIGIVRWLHEKMKWKILNKSLYIKR